MISIQPWIQSNLELYGKPIPDTKLFQFNLGFNQTYPPGKDSTISLLAFPDTDFGNAERLVARHGVDLKYCVEMDSWLVWDGTRWLKDEKYKVYRRAMETIRAFRLEAEEELEKVKEKYADKTIAELSKKEQQEIKRKWKKPKNGYSLPGKVNLNQESKP